LFSLNLFDFNLGRTAADSPYASVSISVVYTDGLVPRDCVGGILSMGSGFPSDLAIIGAPSSSRLQSIINITSNRGRILEVV